ncbi:MAG TPA: helix-turn-helix transcriptional regulator [Salinimicrobium sp.]|nr:helix-turn-helix transcriptional regulator [Salinimicrobium sp.]
MLKTLSKQENIIAEHVALGFSEKEIGDKLCISAKTVHNHTYNIRKKINARSAVDIARQFILSLEDPKAFFAALTFLVIQFHIMVDMPDIDLRNTARTTARVRVKTSKKGKDEYQF